ncbi:MAG: HlyD family efflux transporter periplasmic adaptor subunit [Betaproteobacteria bacterium]
MPHRTRARWIALAAVVLAVACVVAWWFYGRGNGAPEYRLAKVERGGITAVVSASGTLSAVTTVAVGSQISGQIKALYADFNSPVKKDQLLARIDPETYELKVKQAQADLDAAQSAVVNQQGNVLVLKSQEIRARIQANDAKADLDRKQSLVAKGFISGADLDKAQFNYDALAEGVKTAAAQVKVGESQVANAVAVVKQREAALAAARVDLTRTSIVAPVNGVVISRQVDAGQTVAASLNTPTLFTIAQDLREMQVEVAIDESDISKIKVGQRVTYTVDAFPNRTFEGKVNQIRKAAVNQQNVVTYTVVVATDNPNLLLVPGMTANVRIVADARDNVLKIANAALRWRPAGTAAAKDDAASTGAGGGGGGGGPGDAQARRQRLVDDLKLDAAQQARLDEIFAELRAKMAELRDVPEADRRTRSERLRADVRQKINAMLRPDQQPKYAEIVAAETGRSAGGGAGRAWTVGADGKPQEAKLRLGLTDGSSTEISGGELKEGSEVIVGAAERNATAAKSGSSAPRLPF